MGAPHPLRRASPVIAVCFLAMVAAVVGAPFVGTTSISFAKVFSGAIPAPDNLDRQIFLIARLPRASRRRSSAAAWRRPGSCSGAAP